VAGIGEPNWQIAKTLAEAITNALVVDNDNLTKGEKLTVI
jgi:hypothetical protein